VFSVHDLAKHGIKLSNLRMLRAVNGSIPRGAPRMPCKDIFVALLVLMEKG
jgi:hypothetical protein